MGVDKSESVCLMEVRYLVCFINAHTAFLLCTAAMGVGTVQGMMHPSSQFSTRSTIHKMGRGTQLHGGPPFRPSSIQVQVLLDGFIFTCGFFLFIINLVYQLKKTLKNIGLSFPSSIKHFFSLF